MPQHQHYLPNTNMPQHKTTTCPISTCLNTNLLPAPLSTSPSPTPLPLNSPTSLNKSCSYRSFPCSCRGETSAAACSAGWLGSHLSAAHRGGGSICVRTVRGATLSSECSPLAIISAPLPKSPSPTPPPLNRSNYIIVTNSKKLRFLPQQRHKSCGLLGRLAGEPFARCARRRREQLRTRSAR